MSVHEANFADGVPRASENRKRDEFVLPSEVFRRRLREWREIRGLSQAELAERMRTQGEPLTGKKISELEAGDRRVQLDELFVFAHVLDVPLAKLITPEEGSEDHVRISNSIGFDGAETRNWLVFGPPWHATSRNAQTMMRAAFEIQLWTAAIYDKETSEPDRAKAQKELRQAIDRLVAVADRRPGLMRRLRLAS